MNRFKKRVPPHGKVQSHCFRPSTAECAHAFTLSQTLRSEAENFHEKCLSVVNWTSHKEDSHRKRNLNAIFHESGPERRGYWRTHTVHSELRFVRIHFPRIQPRCARGTLPAIRVWVSRETIQSEFFMLAHHNAVSNLSRSPWSNLQLFPFINDVRSTG